MPNSGISISGHGAVLAELKSRARKAQNRTIRVGYSAPYAVYVHENLEAYHANGQAKFLEQPMKEKRRELLRLISAGLRPLKPDTDMSQPLLEAGRELLALSQRLVPVDTGFLRDSGFCYLVG